MKAGILYVVGTPIGNLDDLTLRAIQVLKRVHAIACEDTRTAMKLTGRLEIGPRLLSFFEHSPRSRLQEIVDLLTQGRDVALISEAGTPLVSDPGWKLVDEALRLGFAVVPVPGPSAVTAAASVSGLPMSRFIFEGFLPRRRARRRKILKSLASLQRPIVFFESPHRIVAALEDVRAVLGNRTVVVARELTKIHEEVRRGPVSSMIEHVKKNPRGEFTVIVGTEGEGGPTSGE